jgi:triacylglycerol esterase/lipase EstA (alpha/beta hydrolase family)
MALPTVILPGFFAGAAPYQPVLEALNTLGIPATIVPLTRDSWWPTVGGRPMTPILTQLAATVEQTCQQYGCDRVNVVGHSAGGWIARIFLGDQPYGGQCWQGWQRVASLVTLGTPHQSQEQWTRRNIDFVNDTYPGAFWEPVRYVCVAGRSVQGRRQWNQWQQWIAYNSYQLTCGQGNTWGDGITPVVSAHLPGAVNLTWEDVVHSPGSSRPWYGSPALVPQWAEYLI